MRSYLDRKTWCLWFLGTFCSFSLQAQNIEVKAYKTRLSEVMASIADQVKKKVVLNTESNPLISFGSKDTPLVETLKKLENLYNFKFELNKDEIIVSDKEEVGKKAGRGLASLEPGEIDSLTPQEQRSNGLRFRTINMNFQDPSKVLDRVKKIVGDDIKFLETDDKNKALVFYSDEETARLIRQIVDDVDIAPPQILLSARIVEMSRGLDTAFGVNWARNPGPAKGDIKINDPGAATSKFTLGYKFGIIDSTGLDAALFASESRGVSKTISNPQVMTSDDVAANLSSDTSFAVKVTSTAAGGAATTSVEKFSAGLKLQVTPKVLRDSKMRLKMSVDNGDLGAVTGPDGIPAIQNTGVKTEMVLRSGQTAAIAGLYKNVNTDTNSGVPHAMDVPLFGWLFKQNSKADTKRELMVFITPALIETPNERSISLATDTENASKPR